MSGSVHDQNPSFAYKKGLSPKVKKSMSRNLGGALKTKRKLTSFLEKAERLSLENTLPDEGESSDPEQVAEMSDEEHANVTSVFNLESAMMVDSNDETAPSVPHMRSFSDGILYRKLTCNSILVSIEPFRKLHFAGKALIQVLKGTVNVHGFHFGPDEKKYTVFSAKGHSSIAYIQAVSRGGSSSVNASGEGLEHISDDEFYSATGALVVMEGFENEWCEGLRQTHPQGINYIGPSMTGIGPGKLPPPKHFMEKLGFQFISGKKSEKYKLMDFPAYFDDIFNDLVQKYDCSTGKICSFGGKGVGKSTFVRWLINRFLSYSGNASGKVLFLDFDPGQTEFTPPGVLSAHICSEPILGPNFSHLREPNRAIFFGGVNVADFPISYIKGVADLFEFCSAQEDFAGFPWVINTMGFCRGLGVDLACEIIKIVRPNSVVQINIDNEKRSFPFLLNSANVSKHGTFLSEHLAPKYQERLQEYAFLSVNSVCNRDNSNVGAWGAMPKVLREITIVSYFAEKIGSTEDCTLRSVIPQCVPLDSIAIGSMNSNLSYDEILATLNGNLVALCEMSDFSFESVDGSDKKFIRTAGNCPNNFLGYGIVRAVDKKADLLYLITTLQEADMILKVNVILGAGAVGLPVHFYFPSNKEKEIGELPYVISRNEGTSTLHTAAKKFFVPKRVVHPVLKNCLL